MLTIARTALASLCLAMISGPRADELPPLPSDLPVLAPQPLPAAPRTPRVTISRPAVPQPANPGVRTLTPAVPAYQPKTVGDDLLQWDAISKDYTAQPGETAAHINFSVTNISSSSIVVNWVRPSCGCTAAKIPPVPWTLAPGEGGTLEFTMDLRGKYGILSKYVTIDTSHGQKLLNLRVNIPQAQQAAGGGPDARTRNMQLAMADRQTVFRGDCASCHAAPAAGKRGEQLYAAACAICHDAPHRATMVPDLRALKNATGQEYWAHWIANGKPGSLMPAFAKAQGGPLDEEQIQSLAEFLYQTFPKASPATASIPAAGASVKN